MSLDLTDDYDLFDNTEAVTVTLQQRSIGGSTATVSIDTALRRAVDLRNPVYAQMLARHEGTTWHIAVDELGASNDIRPGDLITDSAGDAWTVKDSQLQTLSSRWRAVCRKEQ